jgi:nucleoside-diphosphate-sugar epimerase
VGIHHKNMKILVTGGNGYVGQNLILLLSNVNSSKKLNIESILLLDYVFSESNIVKYEHFDNFDDSPKSLEESIKYWYKNIDLREYSSIDKIIGKFHPTMIIHLASWV